MVVFVVFFVIIVVILAIINKHTGAFGYYNWRTMQYVQRPGEGLLRPENAAKLYDGWGPQRPIMPLALRDAVFERACVGPNLYRCTYCGLRGTRYAVRWEIDHVLPFSRGGPTTLGNLVLSCRDCNQRKGTAIWSVDSAPSIHSVPRVTYTTTDSYTPPPAPPAAPFKIPLRP